MTKNQGDKNKNVKKNDNKEKSQNKEEGKYVDLPGAEKGKVVVRFPPEASGYLHIGHAKAALLNQHYQKAFEGKLVFRFDDTNPEKEKEDFEEVIREDVAMLEIKPDYCSYTSDNFDLYLEKCEFLIKEGKAYVDDTAPETMKIEREQRVESKNRNNSVEKNLSMWEEMKNGTELGQKCCVRAKIDMKSDNGCLRDPALYRCKNTPHPRTGNKYKVYPTYDFACPIVDSIEGVTHCLRTTEYMDRDVQFYWIIDALGLRKPYIYGYSRLNMTHTVLSKRKLTWFVENKIVKGWDDPRMPTVRGVLRRGLTVQGLKDFIIAQGSSRSVVFMEWDKIWNFNKKVIDPTAIRYMAVEKKDAVTVNIENIDFPSIEVNCHPKNTDLGKREMTVSNKLLIDQADAVLLKEQEYTTFINLGNVMINKIVKDSNGLVKEIFGAYDKNNKDFKKTIKITWLNFLDTVSAKFFYYENLIVKPILDKDDEFKDYINTESEIEVEFLVEKNFSNLKKGDIIQVLRKGFFICDQPFLKQALSHTSLDSNIHLFSIPDGTTDLNNFPKIVQQAKLNLSMKCLEIKEKSAAAKKIETTKSINSSSNVSMDMFLKVQQQGDKIRELKNNKVSKDALKPEIDLLLKLKQEYKNVTGQEFNANQPPKIEKSSESANSGDEINIKIKEQGDKIRKLKESKISADELKPELNVLFKLKEDFKALTGKDWVPEKSSNQPRKSDNKPKEKPQQKSKEKPQQKPKDNKNIQDDKKKHQTRLCLEYKKSENFSEWYSEIIIKSEMIDYYDISGCYVLWEWSFSIWENIVKFLDENIKRIGVKNVAFPLFVSKNSLEVEKNHIADFAPEVAWVTKSGQSDLQEPIAIRPTSETVMYPYFSKRIKSHRDLPLKVNQWNNVVRWEFKDPTPFLRTREFYWQEGHTAHATTDEALKEVMEVLDFYAKTYEDLLAVPMIKGKKTEKEKFPGGDMTTTIEGYISENGRGIQAATSHYLGQNFSKMFNITYLDTTNKKQFVYQNSWGFTTRSIGVMIMEHSDDKGLVLPPAVAPIQVILVQCGITTNSKPEEVEKIHSSVKKLEKILVDNGIRAESDLSDNNSPGWKYSHWDMKGVPLRIDLGPKDLEKNEFVAARRDTGEKVSRKIDNLVDSVKSLLKDIQDNLFQVAKTKRDNKLKNVDNMNDFNKFLNDKCLILAPFCGDENCEEAIKKATVKTDESGTLLMGAKSLCIPFDQPKKIEENTKCVNNECNKKPQFYTLFGRSY